MEAFLNKTPILEEISCLSVVNQLVETIWVDEPSGEIETCKISKENGIIRSVVQKIKYNLKSFSLFIKCDKKMGKIIISDLPSQQTITNNQSLSRKASDDINRIFISEIDRFKNTQKFDFPFYRNGLISKIMGWNSRSKLNSKILEMSKECSWIIIPKCVVQDLDLTENLTTSKRRNTNIFELIGKIGNTSVYLNPLEERKVIYFGNYDSITIILNRNIQEEECKWHFSNETNKSIKVDYLVFENGLTKRLNLE